MRSIVISSVLAALLSTTALADNVIIQNEYVKAGVNETTGTFGSGGNTRPGLQYDSTGTSTFPADGEQGDYLTPGAPFDGFTVDVDGIAYTNNNSGGASGIASNGWTGTPTADSATWSGGVTGVFDITNTYSLPSGQEYIDITTGITAQTAITTLRFGRFIDPDAMPAAGDTSATDNVLGYGTIPTANVVFSEATVSRYALGLYSTDSNVGAGISSGWSTDPNDYATGGDYDVGNGDDTIGLGWEWTGLTAGDIVTANYAYIFGPSAFDAADTAITGGAGGGVDITTGTLEDVGSATDAASGSTEPAAPTVVGSASSSVTTHSSTTADGVQTIARETSTSTWDVYSDASLGTPVVVVTDPGSFTGRMDQVDQMLALRPHNGVSIGEGLTASRVAHDMGNGYSADSTMFGLGHNAVTDDAMTIGFGFNRITTDITGSDSTGNMSTTILSLGASKHIDDRDITVSGQVNASSADLSYTRTIGDFSTAGTTTSSDNWGSLTVEKSTGMLRPFAGVTVGSNNHKGFTETGDVQASLVDAGNEDNYRYATLGVNFDNGIVSASLARDFDDAATTHLELGVDYSMFEAGVKRTTAGDNTSTTLTAGINWKF